MPKKTDNYILKNSTRKNKKYMLVTPDDKKVHFGAKNMDDFTLIKDRGDASRRRLFYIDRHKTREQKYWAHTKANLVRPSYLSRYLLWQKPTLSQAIKFVEKNQNIKIVNNIK